MNEGKVVVLLLIGGFLCITTAGPVSQNRAQCSQECPGDNKFQYLEKSTYVYSFEASNTLHMERSSELSSVLKATIEITPVSKCDMVLEVLDASVKHGASLDSASAYIESLKKNPLHFAFLDGKIASVCPEATETEDVLNVKRGILSTLQNTMKTLSHDSFLRETDVLGSCDTEYKVKENKGDRYVIYKTKDMSSCTNHINGRSGFTGTAYESPASLSQHLPLMTNREYSCHNIMGGGIVQEAFCTETGYFKPLQKLGYAVKTVGEVKLQFIAIHPGQAKAVGPNPRKTLGYVYHPHNRPHQEAEATAAVHELCEKADGLLKKDVGSIVHKLIYLVRGLPPDTVKKLYESLKNQEHCNSPIALGIFLDVLKTAASEGAFGVLTELATTKEISNVEFMLWMAAMPFASDPEEGAVRATIPLLGKDFGSKQALLSVSSMAHKYCLNHPDCESRPAIQGVISALQTYIHDNCHTTSVDEEEEIITALKAFGNLGFLGTSKESIIKCVRSSDSPENSIPIRLAAVEAFRRSPCSDSISSELLKIYENADEHDEVRIAAVMVLSKCPSPAIIYRMSKTYSTEKNRQVAVFMSSYFNNLKTTSDPLKLKAKLAASKLTINPPESVDITKFSRNFEMSSFIETANLGYGVEANVIHSQNSFLPRSGNLDFKIDVFGQQLNLLEVGLRMEDMDYALERFLGPRGLLSSSLFYERHSHHSNSADSTADVYKTRINGLKEKVHLNRGHDPKGSLYIRILGNELRYRQIDTGRLNDLADINLNQVMERLTRYKNINAGHSFVFLDNSLLFPSVTGRAYKLAANGSATLGLKSDGKLDFQDTSLRNLQFILDKRYQPSVTVEVDATMSIHSEDYEPGLKVATTLNLGHDVEVKLELKKGPSLTAKVNFPREKIEILNFKRDIYEFDDAGERALPKPKMYSAAFCTKYINTILGVQFCGQFEVPHIYDSDGKFHIDLTGPVEAHLERMRPEGAGDGFEFCIHLPESKDDQVEEYKISFDTPNSSINRKFLAEIIMHYPDKDTRTSKLKFNSPFYNLEADASYVSRADKLEMNLEVLGDQTRKYAASLSVDIDIRGARLAEYKPTFTLALPGINPVRFFGTIVAARGRKQQLSFNIESDNFINNPFLLKGNIAHEGEFFDADSDVQIISEVNIQALSKTYKLYSTYKRVGMEASLDTGLDYFPEDKGVQSIKLKTSLSNIIVSPFSFVLETEMLMSEYPHLNTKINYDFSFKLLRIFKNNVIIHYGSDFQNEERIIQLTCINTLDGDFSTFQELDFQNKVALKVPALKIDADAAFTVVSDFVKKPKFLLEIGIKATPEKQMKLNAHFESLNPYGQRPIKINAEAKFTYLDYEFIFRDQIEEKSPNLLHGRAIIQFRPEKQVTIDHTYAIRSTDQIFYHELECTINIPNFDPIQQKFYLKRSRGSMEFLSHTEFPRLSPFIVEIRINKAGPNELKLTLPTLEGILTLNKQDTDTVLTGDVKIFGRNQRRIVASGKLTHGEPTQIELEISLDADRDPQQKLVLTGKSIKENTGRKITTSVNYAGSINIEVNGNLGDPLRYGPHQIRADFSGNMEPMSVVLSYEISQGELKSTVKYLRNDVEKVRADIDGKFIHRPYHLEIQGGAKIISPYKAFDGKEIYAGLLLDSNKGSRSFVTEYQLKRGPQRGYVAKLEYKRKRGFPGQIKANAVVAVHQRPLYEAGMNAEYGGGRYFFKSSIMPPSNKKLHLDTTMEISARYAVFHHTLVTAFQHLQLFRVNALADLRHSEDLKVQTNFDVNAHKVYDFNATLSSRSITDFEGSVLLFGKIVPSFHIFAKTQNANSLTKYSLSLEKDSNEILSGKGEIRKRKKGFNGDMVFSYKGADILTVDINNESKSQRDRNYMIKIKSRSRSYTISIHYEKEKKGYKYSTAVCRNENDNCINVDFACKDDNDKHEFKIAYKRDDVELNLDRILIESENKGRRSLVLHSGEKRIGYDLEYDFHSAMKHASVGIILPAREIRVGGGIRFSQKDPEIQLIVLSDARHHPERQLTIDVKMDNQIFTNRPTAVDIKITHPIFEKPIEIHTVTNFDSTKDKFLEGEVSVDFSSNPEDKVISKMYLEKHEGRRIDFHMDIYHQDDQHLDFIIKANSTFLDENYEFGIEMLYKDENEEEKNAFMLIKHLAKEEKFHLVYHRPKVDFTVDTTAVHSDHLHADEYAVDFDIVYNQAHTKARLTHNYQTNCRKFDILDTEGAVTRTVELCIDVRNPVIFSLKTMSLDLDHQLTFDYSLEIIRKQLRTINIRHHWNPEFLGGLVFHVTQFSGELADAGVGQLPFAESPTYKRLSQSFNSKVSKPLKEYVLDESKKFFRELVVELRFLKDKMLHYYHELPSLSTVFQYLKSMKPLFDDLCKEAYTYIHEVIKALLADLKNLFNEFLHRGKEITDKFRARCSEYPECSHIINAIENKDFHEVQLAIRSFISRLPPSVQEYVRRGGKIEIFLRRAYDVLSSALEPFLKSEFLEQVLDQLNEGYYMLRRLYGKYSVAFLRTYKSILRDIQQSKAFKDAIRFYKEDGIKILEELRELKFERLRDMLKHVLEHYLPSVRLPTLRGFFKINELDSERGVLDVDTYFPISISIVPEALSRLYSIIIDAIKTPMNCNLRALLALLKRASDLNIVPPYREQALILGQQHYVTFDKTFYDFAGECTYLAATDLIDGNFSIIVTPTFSLSPDDVGEREPSLGVLVRNTAVLINLKDRRIKHGDHLVNLPLETVDLTVTRDGNIITIDDHHGVKVKCHVVYDLCTASISGFYYGKTAGLFGTYDYEPANDFRRPRGQIPNSVTTFAKSWDLNKGCKTKNLVPDLRINKNDNNYKLCEEYFERRSSPLSACFTEVKPEEYLKLCYRHISQLSDSSEHNKGLCNVAAAYVMECESNYVELDLPPLCLTCQLPEDVKMKHGERKTFENVEVKSADTIFVMEASTCNELLVKDLDNIARSIDRELGFAGFSDNMYGLVIFDDSGHDPYIRTVRGRIFFNLDDITESTNNIHLSRSKTTITALEALRLAVTYPFRVGTLKNLILMPCSPCKYNYRSLQYPVIQQILLEHDIVLHVINKQALRVKKAGSLEREIIGVDADTVYHLKGVTQKELTGEPALRSQVSLPKDACIALAQDVDGSFFSTNALSSSDTSKSFRSIFARRVLMTAKRKSTCYICDCTSTADHVANVDCQSCQVKRPRLPFSVCKSCAIHPRLLALYSFFLHLCETTFYSPS